MTEEELVERCHKIWATRHLHADLLPLPMFVSAGELLSLYQAASDPELPAGHLLEIGVALGGTGLALWLANQDRGRGEMYVGVDNLHDHKLQAAFAGGEALLSMVQTLCGLPYVAILIGTSHAVRAVSGGGRAFRFAFVDGDHSYDGALADLENLAYVLLSGATVAMHDVDPKDSYGVADLWHEIQGAGALTLGPARYSVLGRHERIGYLRVRVIA